MKKLIPHQDRSLPFRTQVWSLAALLITLLLTPALSRAATLTWDPLHTPATGSDGAGTWQKSGETLWAVSGANTAWIPDSDASIGAGGTVAAATTIRVTAATSVGNITFNQMAGGNYYLTGSALTLTGPGGTITVSNTAADTLLRIPLAGTVGFTKAGSGTLLLTGMTPTYTGTTRVAEGILRSQNSSGFIATDQTLQVDNGASYDLYAASPTIGALTGDGLVNNSSGSTRTLTIGNGNGSGTFSGSLNPSGGAVRLVVVKTGNGTQIFSGNSTYTGATTVNQGTLLINAPGSLAATPVTVTSGATFGGFGGTTGGSVTYQSGALALFTNGAPMTFSGTLTLNNNTVHLNLPAGLGQGSYTLATYNPTGSSGSFAAIPVIDSGDVGGNQAEIVTGGGTVTLNVTACTGAGISSSPPATTTGFVGGMASMVVVATGSQPTYQWQVNDGLGSGYVNVTAGTGGTSATYTTPTLSGSETGWKYKCIVSVACNGSSQTSSETTLSVVDPAAYSFRSVTNGNWGNPSTWQISSDGATWVASTAVPSALNSNITVQAGHTVTVAANQSADQLTIQSGGKISVTAASAVTFTIAEGTGTDLDASGELEVGSNGALDVTANPQIVFKSGGTFNWNANAAPMIPTANWADGSTCAINNVLSSANSTATGINGTSFYDLTINFPNVGRRLLMGITSDTTIRRNFSITLPDLSGASVAIATSGVLTISNDVTFVTGSSSKILLSSSGTSTPTFKVGGNFSSSGQLDGFGGAVNLLEFNKAGTQTLTLTATLINLTTFNYQVDSGATLQLSSSIPGMGTFTVNDGGTLSFGTSQFTGAGTLTVNPTGSLVGNGTSQLTTALTAINYGGTLNLPGLPDTLNNGDSIKLFEATGYSGAFASIVPATTPVTGFGWDQSQIAVNGTLYVGATIVPVLKITSSQLAGDQLTLTGTGGTASGSFTVLTTTNVTTPMGSWSTWATGNFDGSGNFSTTGTIPGGTQSYFRISEP
jgi:fibronectin-binding autotransporter adhesin